ncbi:hypothetical protein SLA2020_108140 [Shorea laevis]
MIRWEDVYKVVAAMTPLYFALMLGYGSVKWWRIFKPDQCDAINRLVCYFILPLFTLEFTANINPFQMNYQLIGADVISKLIVVVVLAFWANCSSKGTYAWSITSFSLATLANTLLIGAPIMKAMYGPMAVDLVVQLAVVQAIIWFPIMLFVLEFRRSRISIASGKEDAGGGEKDLERSTDVAVSGRPPSFWMLMKVVGLKLAKNPRCYACTVGVAWAFLASRWHFKMPSIMEGCILILSRAGTGTAMFNMGIFMALQEKLIACGTSLTIFGMVLRFIAGPASTAIGAVAVGLHRDVFHVAIIQAALPQSIATFIFAKEYGLHADVLSSAVIFGTIVSLPVMIAYYAVMESVH